MKTLIIIVVALAGFVPASGAFIPDRPTFVQQNTVWRGNGDSASVPAVTIQSFPWYLTCGNVDLTKGKGTQPQSILSNTDSCGNAFGAVFLWEQNYENYDSAYDTMQWYIRHCYPNANAGQTWGAYNDSWSAVLNIPGGRDSIFNFVLYGLGLRSDDEWFCFGVPLLQVKYVEPNGVTNYRACRAIDRFLMDNPRCAWNYDADSTDYSNLLRVQWNYWSDTATSGVFDSTIPTLHDLGLDTLLSFASVAVYETLGPQIIMSASITENPFQNSTSVSLSIGREAYLHIGVYNVLGQQVPGAGFDGVFEQGSRDIPINMSNAPPGAYYVRISTANNETQTLKLTKE
jgi:hypothetical protein